MHYIHPLAQIGENVEIGFYTVIYENVQIGSDTVIGNNVVIYPDTKIGDRVRIDDGAVIGKAPMRSVRTALKQSDDLAPSKIGDDCIIGTGAIVYRGCVVGDKVMVADLATLRENTEIGEETIIGRGAAVENYCSIGSRCKIETNAYITAYSKLEDNVFIAPGVVTSNDNFAGRTKERFKYYKGVVVKRGGRIGAQATVLPGRVIGSDGFVGAGSVVTKDIEDKMIYVGNPAKKKKEVPSNQLLENQK